MDLFDISRTLAEYLHEGGETFADVADQLERQTNQTLDLMRQDDEEVARGDVTVVEPPEPTVVELPEPEAGSSCANRLPLW